MGSTIVSLLCLSKESAPEPCFGNVQKKQYSVVTSSKENVVPEIYAMSFGFPLSRNGKFFSEKKAK